MDCFPPSPCISNLPSLFPWSAQHMQKRHSSTNVETSTKGPPLSSTVHMGALPRSYLTLMSYPIAFLLLSLRLMTYYFTIFYAFDFTGFTLHMWALGLLFDLTFNDILLYSISDLDFTSFYMPTLYIFI